MKICKPFKNATKASITQGFHSEHLANDFAGKYGEFLVSPFNGKVVNIIGAETLDGSQDLLRNGCGIKIQSAEDPSMSISYWHTLQIFPVKKGDVVLMGQPVAQLGNTGFVLANGKYVEIDIRTLPPYPGTHVHITYGKVKEDGTYENLDYSSFIDWDIPIKYDLITAIMATLQSIKNILKIS